MKTKVFRKHTKKFISLLLALSVMASLLVPFEVFSAETPEQSATGAGDAATDDNIFALLYIKDKSLTTSAVDNFNGYRTSKNMELVFQNNNTPDPSKILIATYSGFAGTRYHSRDIQVSNSVPEVKNGKYMPVPWYQCNNYTQNGQWEVTARNIVSVNFKDKIAPTYIASWFYGFQRILEFKNLENLDTSNCKDMSYAFYCSTSESWEWDVPEVYSLDFSHCDTSNVEEIDNFIRINSLKSLNLSGLDLTKVKWLVNFITYSSWLTNINFTGFDISKVNLISGFITNCKALESVDISSINPTYAHDVINFFYNDTALKNVKFASHFSPGRDFPTTATEAPAGYDGLTYTSGGITYIAGSGLSRVRINAMFSGCSSIEEIDLSDWDLFYTTADNALSARNYEMSNFFNGCKSLTKIKNIDHLIIEENNSGGWTHRYMFEGCESLESIDLSNSKTMIGGPGIFKGCTNLRKLDLSGLGQNWWKNTWHYTNSLKFNELDGAAGVNIYDGCEEISEVSFSQYYPPKNQVLTNNVTIGSGVNKPVEREWIKIAQPDDIENEYYYYTKSDGTKQKHRYPVSNGNGGYIWKYIVDDYHDLVPVNTTKSTSELFGDFQPEYAGTWVAVSKITFNAKGGTPAQQSVEGARNMMLNIPDGALTEPTRNGYTFKGWFYEDENGVEREFVNNAIAESWTYYAKWEPIKYNIVLHSNENTDQTQTISDVKYDQFVPLSSSTFTSSDSSKILAGWNTSAAGNGEDFAANESVDKLTTIDGNTVDLYAMWRIPDAIITFDSQGGSSVASRDYTLQDGVNTSYGHLSEPVRDGYTFAGWYTQPNGAGRKVVIVETDPATETAYVSGSETLYAYWIKKPIITFKLQGGEINNDNADYIKVADYGQAIGSVPTPANGSQSFEGWYTEPSGGHKMTELASTPATGDAIYYAHWGWKPLFETNGGSYPLVVDEDSGEKYYLNPSYAIQDNPSYNLGILPIVTRANYTFDGWYTETDEKVENNQTIDLSAVGSVLKAKWTRNPTSSVTLNPDGGTYTIDGESVSEQKVYTQVYNGEQIGELPVPVKEHADFVGWYSDDTKYTYQSVINEDVTLTARWKAHTHTVTFDPTEGEMAGDTTYTIAHGKSFTYLPGANCVESSGGSSIVKKSFEGWYTGQNGTGDKLEVTTPINSDVTYYANWVDNRVEQGNYNSMIRWGTLSSADVTNVGDTLVFHPQGKGNVAAHLTVDIALINQDTPLQKNQVRITLPKEMFVGWNNTDVTTTDAVFPGFSTANDGNGNFVLTNNSTFKSTVFEPTYTVDPMKVKGGYTDENGVYRDFFEKQFTVKIELWDSETESFKLFQERTLGVEFHTTVQTKIVKEQSTATLNWNSQWGPEPADSKEYFYVIWNLKSNNVNSTQPYSLNWSENTVHDGSIVYAPSLGVWSPEYTSDSNNVMQVVTKHRRDEAMSQGSWAEVKNEAILSVKWKSGYEEQFRTVGKATAYVGEEYPDGDRSMTKFIPNPDTQKDHYIEGGQDLILNGEANALKELTYNLTYIEDINTDNPSWTNADEMSVAPRTYVISDGIKGRDDVLISGVKETDTANKSSWEAADQTQLDDGDYYFTYLDITVNEYDSAKLNDKWAKPYQNNNIYDYHNIIVYIRKTGTDNFEALKTFYPSELHPLDNGGYQAYIKLPDGTVGYKVEYTSERYTTEIKVSTGLKLNSTRKIHSLVSSHANAGKHTIIKNKAQMNISREGKEDYVCESKEFNAWRSSYELSISESELKVSKSCLNENNNSQSSYFDTDDVASTVEFPVAISGWAYSKNQLGYYKRVKSGVFYDLLPHGFIVDKSTVVVCARSKEHCIGMGGKDDQPESVKRNGKELNGEASTGFATSYNTGFRFPGKISSDYYSVTFKDNWEGSGKTMMIVNISCPENVIATGFVVYYKSKTTINNLHINGTTPKNYVSFTDTTEEQSLPEVRTMTRDGIPDSSIKSLFASVDNNQTAYNYAETTLKTPTVYQYGADSGVTTEGSDISRHQVVGLNTDYAYNISYDSSSANQTHNLIIYDVIEKQIGGNESLWQGEFKSVDVSTIRNQPSAQASDGNCAPVIYYSTKPKDEFTQQMFDLDTYKDTIWSTTPPANLNDVTAIAVDCRKTNQNKDFVLGKNKGLEFTINMHSPSDETRSDIDTYNEAVISGMNKESGFDINVNTRTIVTLRFTNPRFEKTAFPKSGTSDNPESVVSNSILSYTLSIKNPDPDVAMMNIVVEDRFPMALVPNNRYTVRFNGGESIPIDNTARVNYTITEDNAEGVRVFTATIDTLEPDETVEITIPVKVGLPKNSNPDGVDIINEAKVTSINGVPYSNIISNKTYHEVTGVKAKILKVNSKGEPLEGAKLEIYEQNDTNCDANGKLKEGAVPMQLTNDETDYGSFFTSTNEVARFDVPAGSYILHEKEVPAGGAYELAEDIPFSVDVEGIIHVNNETVSYVEMMDEPPFKIVFHENNQEIDDKNVVYRIYEPQNLTDDKIQHFYDIPSFAGDEYVFKGWYHNSGYTQTDSPNSETLTPADFEHDTFSAKNTADANDPDYHLYAKWIKVGSVSKDDTDTNIVSGYRGFGLAGVQIRPKTIMVKDPETGEYAEAQMFDPNIRDRDPANPGFNDDIYNDSAVATPEGLRFITSLSEELLGKINGIEKIASTPDAGKSFGVEYGYAVGTEENINQFIDHYNVEDKSAYNLQYKGENVNGVNTTVKNSGAESDYRYITNIDCTSNEGYGTKNSNPGRVKLDHRNFEGYRLYTLVVTYDTDDSRNKLDDKIDARSYIRYYDANGKLRVFYNTYKKNVYYGGCMCSFNQVSSIALGSAAAQD